MLTCIKHGMNICAFAGSGRGQGKLCYRFLSDSILRLYYFYPTSACWCNSLNKKAPKELYERRQRQIGDEDVIFIFPLFPGFNNHSMGEGIFPEYNWNGWMLQSRCLEKYVNRFLVYVSPHLVFKSFNNVPVAFGSLSKSSVLVRSFCILAYC